jgi:hypothetical protein
MITLTFSPLATGSQVLIRAPFFRICSDSALRGPESTLVASYVSHMWRVGARQFREFHCNDVVYVRVTTPESEHRQHGPYEFLRVAAGGLFVGGRCVGAYSPRSGDEHGVAHWHEITLLPAAATLPRP